MYIKTLQRHLLIYMNNQTQPEYLLVHNVLIFRLPLQPFFFTDGIIKAGYI